MNNTDLEYHKNLLVLYDDNIKSYRKKNKWNKIYLYICLLNFVIQSFNLYVKVINNKNGIVLAIIATFLWAISASVTYFLSIRSINKLINENKKLYNEELKIVDYSKFIKEERTNKLKKLKKLWHS